MKNKDIKQLYIMLFIILYFIIILTIKVCFADCIGNFKEWKFIVDYITFVNNKITVDEAGLIACNIIDLSKQEYISWELVLAIMKVESHFNRYAISEKEARGLMQVYTLECNGIKINKNRLYEIRYNIASGICILKEKIKIANDDIELAIMLYNGKGEITKEYLKEVKKTLKHIIKTFNNKIIAYE